MDGFAISSGAACSSGKVQDNMLLKQWVLAQSKYVVRISFGWENTEDDISALADAIIALTNALKKINFLKFRMVASYYLLNLMVESIK